MKPQQQRQESIRRLGNMLEAFRVAMLTTVAEDGSLHSRPMATQYANFDGDLWFFTHAHAHKATDVVRRGQVNVNYVDPDREQYVSVSGTAELVQDRGKMKELWNPNYKAWFPRGLEDPDLALLRIKLEQAEYWDSQKEMMAQIISPL